MSLRVWLPLNGNLHNQGLSNVTVTNNGATVDDNGKIGKCYYFNGSSDIRISMPSNMTTIKNTSVAAWIKSTGSVIALGGISNDVDYTKSMVTLYTSGWQFASGDSSLRYRYVSSGLSANNGIWHHVCCTISDDAVTTYLDGNKVTSKTFTEISLNVTDITSANFIEIGCDHSGGDERLTGYVNDFRIYDHALSAKEVKELSKGLVCHYPLNQAFPIDNLVRNQTYAVYNNYASSGSTGTLVKTGERYNDCDVYRLTYTPNDTSLANVQSTLYSHGVYGFNKKFLANTKYCFWILWRAISHPDTVCGGTASNIGGWTEIPTKKFSGEWNIVGQYRNGSVTADKTDYIFTSFKTPSATSGTPIIIDFCCPHLVEGYDYILPENSYSGDPVTKIYDTSGNGYDSLINLNAQTSSNTPRNSVSTYFGDYNTPKTSLIDTSFLSCLNSCSVSWWEYCTNSGNTLIFSSATTKYIGAGSTTTRLYDQGIGSSGITFYKDGVQVKTTQGTTVYHPGTYHTVNEWHHFVITGANLSAWTQFYINSYSSWPVNGHLSDVRIYNTVLSEDDVKRLYEVGSSILNNGSIETYELLEYGSRELLAVPYTNWYSQHNDIPSNWYKNINNGEIYFESTTVGSHAAGSKYIPINPTNKTYYYDMLISVSAGNLFYVGFERYDKDKTPRSNNATVYIFGSKPSSDLVKVRYKGTVNLSTDGVNPCAFIALRILNRWSGSTTETEGKATVHYLSLREVNSSGFETTQLFKTGTFKTDMFIEKGNNTNIEKTGVINTSTKFIEI